MSALKGIKEIGVAAFVIIAENPRSGAGSGAASIDALQRELQRAGRRVVRLNQPAKIREAIEEAQSQKLADQDQSSDSVSPASGDEFEGVIAAGGDGTVSMLADWLHPSTPLGIFPLGTENLLARHFLFSTDARAFVERWISAPRLRLDAGLANGKLFLVMASVGFDADVVTRLHRERKGHIRHWSYFKPLWKSIRKYQYPELRIVTDNHSRPIKARWAWIFNVPRYAMNLPILPDANGHDGKLDLCTFRGGWLLKGLLYFIGVLLRRHRGWRDTHVERAMRVRIESDVAVPYQLDGDPGGYLPLEIEVLPARLTLVGPTSEQAATASSW